MKSKKRKTKENVTTGITLIALVVTIVVLLILASVSITVVFGDNGILQLAKEAGEKTNEAVKNDISGIGELEDALHEAQTGITVEKVTDKNPGELEQSEDGNAYIINSIEDLVFFAHDVTNGNTYADKTVKLGLSLDFASTKSYVDANRTDYGEYGYNGNLKTMLTSGEGFKPIGERFSGIFDGNGFVLYNLLICENIEERDNYNPLGMFKDNLGIIKNLGIEHINFDCVIYAKYPAVGGLVGVNVGTLDNCYVRGSIYCEASGVGITVGELVGNNQGKIRNSFADVNLKFDGKSAVEENGQLRIGGIAGINERNSDAEINNVYNIGSITIVNTENIPNKYNIYFGGICGWNHAKISNSYSIAPLKISGGWYLLWMNGVVGREQASETVSNNYYLENILENKFASNLMGTFNDKSKEMTSQEMKTPGFVESIDCGQNVWVEDKNNINDGYPILTWQTEND